MDGAGEEVLTPLDAIERVRELPLEIEWVREASDILADRAGRKRFSGGRLAKGDPEKYARIVKLSALGLTSRQVADIEKCSRNTVTAILIHEQAGKAAEMCREEVAAPLGVAARKLAHEILERLSDDKRRREISDKDLAVLFREVTEKKELLSGGATRRTETGATSEEERKAEAERHAREADALIRGGEIIDV